MAGVGAIGMRLRRRPHTLHTSAPRMQEASRATNALFPFIAARRNVGTFCPTERAMPAGQERKLGQR